MKQRSKKLLSDGVRRPWIGAPLTRKVFLLLFVHKKKILLLLPLLLTGCSGTDVLNAFAPSSGIVVRHDLAYGSGPRRGLDLYAPADASHAPVAVFFYGGGWTEGARAEYRFVGATLAAHGIVTIVPDYRLYPEVRYPAFIQDGAAAIAWARTHAADYGGDPHKLFLIGHSAGAYIAMMLALDPEWLAPYGIAPRDLAGVVGISGPYDFLPLDTDQLRDIFAPAQPLSVSQPINHVGGAIPPVLLLTGSADHTVLPRNSYNLAAAIRAKGGEVEVKTYPGLNHAFALGAIATPLTFLAPVQGDVTAFIMRETR